jgi:serine/threonine protein kinase
MHYFVPGEDLEITAHFPQRRKYAAEQATARGVFFYTGRWDYGQGEYMDPWNFPSGYQSNDSIDIPLQGQYSMYNPVAPAAWEHEVKAPVALHSAFHPSEIMPWDPCRFEMVRRIQEAPRNCGEVSLMRDAQFGQLVAIKQMPTTWFCSSHDDFLNTYPDEMEWPWQDVGCVHFLNSVGYTYSCTQYGVFQDKENTYVVRSFAEEGDLFSWCETGFPPSPERERMVTPVHIQILAAVQQLHDMKIVHGDLALENILLDRDKQGVESIQLIDFGMASTTRKNKGVVLGKASYQAPEMHTGEEFDGFLADAFSVGVVIYAIHVKDYPWLSTRPAGCKCFKYVEKHGLRAFLAKRKLRHSQSTVGSCLSEPLQQLLEGMLQFDPAKRLTLGEKCWQGSRPSVWDMVHKHKKWVSISGP